MNGRVTPDRWDESESEEDDPEEEESEEDDPEEEEPPHRYHNTAPEDKISNRYYFTCGADLDFSTVVTEYIKNNILHNTANLKSVHPFKYTRTKNIFYGFSDDESMYDGIFVATFHLLQARGSNFWDIRKFKPSSHHTTALGILEVLTVMGQSGHMKSPEILEQDCDYNESFLSELMFVYESFYSGGMSILLPTPNFIPKASELFFLDRVLKSYTGATTYEIRERHNVGWLTNSIAFKLHSDNSTYLYNVNFNSESRTIYPTLVNFTKDNVTDFRPGFVRPEDIGRDVVTPYYKDPSDKDPRDYSDGYETP